MKKMVCFLKLILYYYIEWTCFVMENRSPIDSDSRENKRLCLLEWADIDVWRNEKFDFLNPNGFKCWVSIALFVQYWSCRRLLIFVSCQC